MTASQKPQELSSFLVLCCGLEDGGRNLTFLCIISIKIFEKLERQTYLQGSFESSISGACLENGQGNGMSAIEM